MIGNEQYTTANTQSSLPTLGKLTEGQAQFRLRMKNEKRLVDTALALRLSELPAGRLKSAMEQAVFAGGKRLRAIVCLEAGIGIGAPLGKLLPAACAIELIHRMSLVHDDLPCMDNANYRNGVPTVHRSFDEATAVLAGDALLVQSFGILATSSHCDFASRIRAISILSDSLGAAGLAGGQSLDLALDRTPSPDNLHLIVNERKTGCLFAASAGIAGELAGASPQRVEHLYQYGLAMGSLFQLADDRADLEEDGRQTNPRQLATEARLLLSRAHNELNQANVRPSFLLASLATATYKRAIEDTNA